MTGTPARNKIPRGYNDFIKMITPILIIELPQAADQAIKIINNTKGPITIKTPTNETINTQKEKQ